VFEEKTKNLFVVAHTDDELFGIGGTILKLNELKNENYLIICTDPNRISVEDLQEILNELNIRLIFFNFNKKPNTINIRDLSEQIVKSLEYFKKQNIIFDNIFTHYKYDFHIDHQKVFDATYLATRPYIYKCNLFSFETYDSSNAYGSDFIPNLFIDIPYKYLEKKIDILNRYYKEELKNGRDLASIRNHMRRWGSLNNLNYCEAFEIVRILI
jgi:LmbE family N-acetylglucosaminyl deacetylase